MLADLYLQGRLELDGFVSETIELEGVEEAFHRIMAGEVLRSVVVLWSTLTLSPERQALKSGILDGGGSGNIGSVFSVWLRFDQRWRWERRCV